jgi:teichuronic acid biosynthesis glycosyltransferase TuaH
VVPPSGHAHGAGHVAEPLIRAEQGLDIVAFPFHDARKAAVQGVRWRDGHIIEELARNDRVRQVLVVDRPTSTAERLVRRARATVSGTQIGQRRSGAARGTLTRTAERMVVLDITVPDVVGPIRRGREWWFEVFARSEVIDLIRWAVAEVMPGRPSVIAWTPTVWPAVAALPAGRLVFDSLDNWITHPLLRKHAASAERGYEALLPRADAVVAPAPKTRDVLLRWAPEVEIIANGVDPSVFQAPSERPADLPAGPIVGYAGTLGPRMDVDLVLAVAARLPAVSFVFIGPDPGRRIVDRVASLEGQASRQRSLPRDHRNIKVLGDRHYRLVPSYVRQFDVAWIPHRVGEGETGGDLIKLYEYWAAGRPVVSTRLDGMDRWANNIHFMEGPADGAATIEGLLDGSIEPRVVEVPDDRTWRRIADRMVGLLTGP